MKPRIERCDTERYPLDGTGWEIEQAWWICLEPEAADVGPFPTWEKAADYVRTFD